jgi:hypothetical protein
VNHCKTLTFEADMAEKERRSLASFELAARLSYANKRDGGAAVFQASRTGRYQDASVQLSSSSTDEPLGVPMAILNRKARLRLSGLP